MAGGANGEGCGFMELIPRGKRMKKIGYLGLVLLAACAGLGMGSLGLENEIKQPEPDQNYTVSLVDQSDVSMSLEQFSCEGQTYLIGRMGRADLSVDFSKIERVDFFSEGDRVRAEVVLKDGRRVALHLKKGTPCYGVAPFADVRIAVEDIKTVVVHGQKEPVE